MKLILRGLLIITLTSFISCKNQRADSSVQAIYLTESSKAATLTSAFFRLEIPEEIKIGDVSQIEHDGQYIYLLQDNTLYRGLYVFDTYGKYIAKIGNFGRGMGEYQQPSAFTLTDNYILILDTSNNYVLKYKRDDFSFVGKTKTFNTSYFEQLGDNLFLFVHRNYEPGQPYYDKEYVLTDSLFQIQSAEIEKIICSPYVTGPGHPIYKFDHEVRTYMQNSPYIYGFTASGNRSVYKIGFDTYNLPPAEFMQQISANGRFYYKDLTDSGYISYYNFFEVSDQIQISFFSNHKGNIGFYSKAKGEGSFAPKEIWQQAYPFSDWITVGTLDDCFVSLLLTEDLRERAQEIALPADLKNILSKCTDNDLIIWKFKLAE